MLDLVSISTFLNSRSHPRFPGLPNHLLHDFINGGWSEEVPSVHEHPECRQLLGVGVHHGGRPLVRRRRQLEPARRIHALRMVRGETPLHIG